MAATPSYLMIGLRDNLNPGFGYQIEVIDLRGERVLFTSRHPVTGKDLLTYHDALEVAAMYDARA
jgi:hypothetical protein